MPRVVAFADIGAQGVRRIDKAPGTPDATNTQFFRATADTPDAPTAFHNKYDPGSKSAAHYHAVDQFQIIVEGKGDFGRHAVSPYCVHFSRAYTPYGPLHSDPKDGWAFITLRTKFDPGAQRFPAKTEQLKQVPDRRPWQVTQKVPFSPPGPGVSVVDATDIIDDQGLFTKTITMAPGTTYRTPDPSGGDGQYVLVVKGGLLHEGSERKAYTIVFIEPHEGSFEVQAGAEGLEAIIMNFPAVTPRPVDAKTPGAKPGMKKWQCVLCSFAYDEAIGLPGEGIPAGTRWEDIPDSWSCPDCAASKADFQMVEVQ